MSEVILFAKLVILPPFDLFCYKLAYLLYLSYRQHSEMFF